MVTSFAVALRLVLEIRRRMVHLPSVLLEFHTGCQLHRRRAMERRLEIAG
jgi:hypothetical protein